jgi:hypothetical protein
MSSLILRVPQPFGRFARLNRQLKFNKRSQLFIRVHHETLSVVAMCVNNEHRSPVGIYAWDAAPTPTGFAEIVSDDFPPLFK